MQIDLKEMFRRWFGSTGKPKIRYPVLNFKWASREIPKEWLDESK